MKKGILRRMADVKDMYKLVKFIASDNYVNSHYGESKTKTFAVNDLLEQYVASKRFWKVTESKALRVFDHTISSDYLTIGVIDDNDTVITVKAPRGTHLIEKQWYFFRVGLWDESLKIYSESQKFFTGAFVGGLITAITGSIGHLVWTWLQS